MTTILLRDREPFFGRAREQAALLEALEAGERLILITGLAGMGKARLARQIAQRLGDEQPPTGGRWCCALEGARSKEELLQAVARSLQLDATGSARVLEERVIRSLAGREEAVLILAGIEGLEADALRSLRRWIERAPDLRLLATSLLPVSLEGCHEFALGPLELEDAIALYEDRAGRAWADRTVGVGERETIAELVQRLDRIPLAIELAAARVRVLPPRAILLRLDDRFDLLHSRRVGDLPSLEQAFERSWGCLDPEERDVLAQASVFVGSFSEEAAREVIHAPEGAALEVLLERLRRKGLLPPASGEGMRWPTYESMQAFAARELQRADVGEAAQRRHAERYLRLARGWAEALETAPQDREEELLAAIADDRGNLLAARRQLAASGEEGEGALELLDGLLRRLDEWRLAAQASATAPPAPVLASVAGGADPRAPQRPGGRAGHLQMVPHPPEGEGAAPERGAGRQGMMVGPDALWFELPGKPRVHLGRRGAQRRLLQALVENRLLAPGQGLSLEQMAHFGWPGEKMSQSAAANRVYTSVNALRKAGLGPILMRQADGYLLSPELPVTRSWS